MSNPYTNIVQLNSGFINEVNDQFVGGGETDRAAIPGMLGKIFYQGADVPAKAVDSTHANHYEGAYQYVKLAASITAAAAKGQICYWSDKGAFTVTMDTPAAQGPSADVAGILLYGGVTDGYHTAIKITGDADVKFLASTTKATPVVGDTVVNGGALGTADVLADATAVVAGTTAAHQVGRKIGHLRVAVSATLARVQLDIAGQV